MKITKVQRIVSISILVLIMVMLIAVSYAYFTARVEGNKEAKEIKVDAAIMSVKLTGPEEITAEDLVPSQSTSIKFQVENTGTVAAIYNLDMIEVENNFDPTSDLVYTITSTNNGGHVKDKEAPTENQTLIRNILIQPGKENIQEYTLTLLFKETEINQDTNQDKIFEGRVQINNLADNTMATRIIRTNKLQTNEPDFTHASPEIVNGVTTDYGSGIFAAEDDDGTSYYFRGAVTNNNIRFAEMDWKILRINGDGSIRLILSNPTDKKVGYNTYYTNYEGVGYTYNNGQVCTQDNPCISDYNQEENTFKGNYDGTDSTSKTYLEDWYIKNLAKFDSLIALSTYCNDTSILTINNDTISYGFTGRANNPLLTCHNPTELNSADTHNYGGVYKLKIGLINGDEMTIMGLHRGTDLRLSSENFLDNFATKAPWSMTPGAFRNTMVYVFTTNNDRKHMGEAISWDPHCIFPVINLKPDVEFTTNGDGDPGTEDNPYIIK